MEVSSNHAAMGPARAEDMDHLNKTAQYLGVSLEVLLELSRSKPVIQGPPTPGYNEIIEADLGVYLSNQLRDPSATRQIPVPDQTIYHSQSTSANGPWNQYSNSFMMCAEGSEIARSGFADQDLFSAESISQGFVFTTHEIQEGIAIGDCLTLEHLTNYESNEASHSYTEIPWGRHSCDNDYIFIPNAAERTDAGISRQPSSQRSDDSEYVLLTPQDSKSSFGSNGSRDHSSRNSPHDDERTILPDQSPRFGNSVDIKPSDFSPLPWLVPKTSQLLTTPKDMVSECSLVVVDNALLDMVQNKPRSSSPNPDVAHKRKKRSRYVGRIREETGLTRQLNACVRCRMQRNRVGENVYCSDIFIVDSSQCIPDPTNPTGPCKPCQENQARIIRLPCLRYKITDSILFRTGLDYMPFYKRHPMVGPKFGDFHLVKIWESNITRFLDITQDRGPVPLTLEVRQFAVPFEENAFDLKGRGMYDIPWAIADVNGAVKAINDYADANMLSYLDALLDKSNPLVWDVFQAAINTSFYPTNVSN